MTTIPPPKDMLGRAGLISVDAARDILLERLAGSDLQTETISIEEALDRVLAKPVTSPEDLPPHPRSVMDGYAVRAADTFGASESLPSYLEVTGNVVMGEFPTSEVVRGCCHRIATGGFLPAGADAVVMLEHSVPVDDTLVEIVKGVGVGTNLIGTGEDIKQGASALPAGQRLRPQDLGLLAGLGIDRVEVYRQVRVATLSTGDEIVPYTETPPPGKIRNINSIVLAGLIRQAGAVPHDLGIISDERSVFLPAMARAVQENDIVIFSGGSSVGVRDLGEEAITSLGPPGILVHGVALKPGKPVLIGLSDTTPVIGLPGHPVSTMICFDLFVRPAIEALSGVKQEIPVPPPSTLATLSRNLNSAAGRRDLVRVQLIERDNQLIAEPILGKSGAISTLSRAHGYFVIDEATQGVTQGSTVKVFFYR